MIERARRADSPASAPDDARVQRAPGKGTQVDATYGPAVQRTAEQGVASGGEPVPFGDELRASFGRHAGALDGATAHTGGDAAAAAGAIGATAYATGNRIAFAQAPDRALVGHEAAHVVQQRAGVQLAGGVGAEGDPYERNADEVGAAFAAGRSAEALLDVFSGGGGTPAVQRQAAPDPAAAGPDFETAESALDVLSDVLDAGGLPIVEEDDHHQVVHAGRFPSGYDKLPMHWQVVIRDWWNITSGSVRGDAALARIAEAELETKPLLDELRAEGKAAEVEAWLAQNYTPQVARVRAHATQEAVAGAIDARSQGAQGGALDFGAMGELDQLKLASATALQTARSTMTVATRVGGANTSQLKAMNDAFAEAELPIPPGMAQQLTGAKDLGTALGMVAGLLNTVQTIVNISDPHARLQRYRAEIARFGDVVAVSDYLKDLGTAVSGCVAVVGVGAYAIAKVTGKADLAAKALAVGRSMSGKLSNVGVALNALGVIHGVAVLCNPDATTSEKAEAGVEAGSGALGLLGRFVPTIAPVTAAMTGSLLINFYTFKEILTEGMRGYMGLVQLGFNICYAHMKATGDSISKQALGYASALDLAGSFTDPDKAAALVKQTEAERWNLVNTLILPFMAEALAPGGNQAPGTYAVLRRRFAALGPPTFDTPDATLTYTRSLLEVIVSCFLDAQELFIAEVQENWQENG